MKSSIEIVEPTSTEEQIKSYLVLINQLRKNSKMDDMSIYAMIKSELDMTSKISPTGKINQNVLDAICAELNIKQNKSIFGPLADKVKKFFA